MEKEDLTKKLLLELDKLASRKSNKKEPETSRYKNRFNFLIKVYQLFFKHIYFLFIKKSASTSVTIQNEVEQDENVDAAHIILEAPSLREIRNRELEKELDNQRRVRGPAEGAFVDDRIALPHKPRMIMETRILALAMIFPRETPKEAYNNSLIWFSFNGDEKISLTPPTHCCFPFGLFSRCLIIYIIQQIISGSDYTKNKETYIDFGSNAEEFLNDIGLSKHYTDFKNLASCLVSTNILYYIEGDSTNDTDEHPIGDLEHEKGKKYLVKINKSILSNINSIFSIPDDKVSLKQLKDFKSSYEIDIYLFFIEKIYCLKKNGPDILYIWEEIYRFNGLGVSRRRRYIEYFTAYFHKVKNKHFSDCDHIFLTDLGVQIKRG